MIAHSIADNVLSVIFFLFFACSLAFIFNVYVLLKFFVVIPEPVVE